MIPKFNLFVLTKQRLILLFCSVALYFSVKNFILNSPLPKNSNSSSHLGVDLSSTSFFDNQQLFIKSESNVWRLLNPIFASEQCFNPSVIQLPNSDFLVVARNDYKSNPSNPLSLYLFLAEIGTDLTFDFDKPALKQKGEIPIIHLNQLLPSSSLETHPFCEGISIGKGVADARLFWSPKGEPLMIFTGPLKKQTGKECRTIWIVDVRSLIDLKTNIDSPIVFNQPTELRREGIEQKNDKNWSPFFSPSLPNELLFHTQYNEPRVFSYRNSSFISRLVYEEEKGKKIENCLEKYIEDHQHIHQCTPMLQLTLCNRGKCVPNRNNTILIGIVQDLHQGIRYSRWYRPFVVTWHMEPPFEYRSVSRPLLIAGIGARHFSYVHSMNWVRRREEVKENLYHGYLDDLLFITIGYNDRESRYLDVKAESLMQNHRFCDKKKERRTKLMA